MFKTFSNAHIVRYKNNCQHTVFGTTASDTALNEAKECTHDIEGLNMIVAGIQNNQEDMHTCQYNPDGSKEKPYLPAQLPQTTNGTDADTDKLHAAEYE